MALETTEHKRYARHISLPEIGAQGQERLKVSQVLVVGAGGLGCPAALYLASCGVGTIGIMDPDEVETSNLQRQILYSEADLGRKKAEAAASRLRALNSSIEVRPYSEALQISNAKEVIQDYDLVLDATDNFNTRYLVNDACYFLKKPYVFASVSKFEGRLSVFGMPSGPCYRCLFPQPPTETILNCAEEGILGVVPGVMGTYQALAALRIILGLHSSEGHFLYLFDLLSTHTRKMAVEPNPDCPLCGTDPKITSLEAVTVACASVPEISSAELIDILKTDFSGRLVDVREVGEFQSGSLPGALSAPLSKILAGQAVFSKDETVYLFCQRGQRSKEAARHLLNQGFSKVFSLSKGLDSWPLDL